MGRISNFRIAGLHVGGGDRPRQAAPVGVSTNRRKFEIRPVNGREHCLVCETNVFFDVKEKTFTDLWLFYDGIEHGYVMYKEGHRYPNYFKASPLKKTWYRLLMIPLATLDLQYPGWRDYILQVYSRSHRFKKPFFKKLRLAIKVEETGLFVPINQYKELKLLN